MNQTAVSIINFVYFTANFQHDFIEQVWPENEAQHFRSKLNNLQVKSGLNFISGGTFIEFVFELSDSNKAILINWIEQNYSWSSVHKTKQHE